MEDDETPDPKDTAFKKRLSEESTKRREALARADEAERKLAEVEKKLATTDTLAAQVNELKAGFAAKEQAWDRERAIFGAGITDPEAVDLVTYLHGKIPEATRPPMADWLTGIKADPTTAPKSLQSWLTPAPKPAAEAAPAPAAAAAKPAAAAAAKATGVDPAGATTAVAPTRYTPAQLKAMQDHGVATGDWSEWKKHQSAVDAQITGTTAPPAAAPAEAAAAGTTPPAA